MRFPIHFDVIDLLLAQHDEIRRKALQQVESLLEFGRTARSRAFGWLDR